MTKYVIVNRYNDIDNGITVSATKGPFKTRKAAEEYNQGAYPSPELNLIVPLHAPWATL